MTPLIRKFPLDLTGVNPDNLVLGEPHELVDNGRDGLRVFVPQYGAFYTDSLVIRDANGITLSPHSDFIATYYYEDASTMSGLEVCAAVVILNPNVPSPASIDYQAVGGDHAFSTTALAEVIEALRDNEQPVQWANIVGKPTMFPPGGHLHALWELYGFEYVTIQLERMVRAILVGDQATLDEIRAYALRLHEDGLAYTDALDERFQLHRADNTNPHSVTKAQVGLGSVPNWPGANQSEAETGERHDRIMTPLRTAQAITTQALTPLNAHINNTSNPHSVTKAQVGLSSVPNWPGASQPEAEAGIRNDRIMTPLRSKQLITRELQNLNASNLTSGRVPDARLTGDYSGLGTISANYFRGLASDSAAAPAFSWSNDTNTGMYRQSDTEISWTINGTKRMGISPTRLWVSGDIVGFSDERVKTNFSPIENALGKVTNLEGLLYDRVDDNTGKRYIGFKAQRVKEILPEVVIEDDNGMYSVAYGNVSALLVEALKEVVERIETLEGGNYAASDR